jgi:hypothetical protein
MLDSFFYPDFWAYHQPSTIYPYNTILGNSLLESAGWSLPGGYTYRIKGGQELAITLTTTNSQFRQTFSEVLKTQLIDCGIRLNLKFVSASWWFGEQNGINRRDFEMGSFAWVQEDDPTTGILNLYGCDYIPYPQNLWIGQNYMGWCNTEANSALINGADTGLTQDQRKPFYAIAQDKFAEDVASIPLFKRGVGSTTWEHLDFNLETFDQSLSANPSSDATLNFQTLGGRGEIIIPAGTFTELVEVIVHPVDNPANEVPIDKLSRHSFQIIITKYGIPVSGTLDHPIQVSVNYIAADVLDTAAENNLALYYWSGSSWEDAFLSCPVPDQYRALDKINKTLIVNVCHLSEFSLLSDWGHTYLPAIRK